MVTVGDSAPDFIATAFDGGEGVTLELFREVQAHDATVLYFYPADFVPECTAELTAARDAGWFDNDDLAIIGLSGDSLFSHAAYTAEYNLDLPLVSDFHGGVAESYDLLAEEWEGHSHIPDRAAVVIDGDWKIRAIEREVEPLAWTSPAPVERAHEYIQETGVDVARPDVRYQ